VSNRPLCRRMTPAPSKGFLSEAGGLSRSIMATTMRPRPPQSRGCRGRRRYRLRGPAKTSVRPGISGKRVSDSSRVINYNLIRQVSRAATARTAVMIRKAIMILVGCSISCTPRHEIRRGVPPRNLLVHGPGTPAFTPGPSTGRSLHRATVTPVVSNETSGPLSPQRFTTRFVWDVRVDMKEESPLGGDILQWPRSTSVVIQENGPGL
jgi:hypothetical protein